MTRFLTKANLNTLDSHALQASAGAGAAAQWPVYPAISSSLHRITASSTGFV